MNDSENCVDLKLSRDDYSADYAFFVGMIPQLKHEIMNGDVTTMNRLYDGYATEVHLSVDHTHQSDSRVDEPAYGKTGIIKHGRVNFLMEHILNFDMHNPDYELLNVASIAMRSKIDAAPTGALTMAQLYRLGRVFNLDSHLAADQDTEFDCTGFKIKPKGDYFNVLLSKESFKFSQETSTLVGIKNMHVRKLDRRLEEPSADENLINLQKNVLTNLASSSTKHLSRSYHYMEIIMDANTLDDLKVRMEHIKNNSRTTGSYFSKARHATIDLYNGKTLFLNIGSRLHDCVKESYNQVANECQQQEKSTQQLGL